ncbi:hypothetical protein C8R43DRAFT_1102784 [Mycena crocata]|nr:hypothetical protein C8R43DRAFT_1102784 [Mycena crocata]
MLASQALFIFFLFFPLLAASTPVVRPILQDIRHTVPRGFVSLGEAPPSKSITLNLALALDNILALGQLLLNISTPSSPNYGKYLSREDDWCSAHNVSCSSVGEAGDWISFTVPVATANKMLSAKYETFQHTESGYSLPAQVAKHIDVVHPSTAFNHPRPHAAIRSAGDSRRRYQPSKQDNSDSNPSPCDPKKYLYGIPSAPAANSTNNSMAVAGFNQQTAQKADLKKFLAEFRPGMSSDTTFSLQTLNGGDNPQVDPSQVVSDDSQEAPYADIILQLDIQYTGAVVSRRSGDVPLAGAVVRTFERDKVVWNGRADREESRIGGANGTVTIARMQAAMYKRLEHNARVIFKSADSGAHHDWISAKSFDELVTKIDGWRDVVFKWMDGMVLGDSQGVQGFLIARFASMFGTSASSPVFASVVALLNDQLIAAGKSQLGFLNPWLYAHPEAFKDISEGNNDACGGLGSPNFGALKKAAGL